MSVAVGFTLGSFLVTATLFFLGPGSGLSFQACFRLLNLGQPLLTPLQFLGQFIAATASQRSILLGVELLGLLQ